MTSPAPDAAPPEPSAAENSAPDTAAPEPAAPERAAGEPAAAVPSAAGAAPAQGQASPRDPEATVAAGRVTVRRAPRIGRFVVLGAGLGAIITFILTALFPADPLVGFGALFGYFMLYGVPIGASVGAIFAIVFDVIATRRAKQLDAERESVDAPEEQLEGELED